MYKQPKLYYFLSLGALVLFLSATVMFGVSTVSHPVVFEGLALLIFLPLTAALYLDWRFKKVFLGHFIIKIFVSVLCLSHIILFAALIVRYIHV